MKTRIILITLICAFAFTNCYKQQPVIQQSPAQNPSGLKKDTIVDVKNIVASPGTYQDEAVRVRGYIAQYIPGTATTTAYYYLRGDYGDGIKVITSSEKPQTLHKYEVRGIVKIDVAASEASLVEQDKTCLDCRDNEDAGTQTWFQKNAALGYIIIGGSILLLFLLILYFALRMMNQRNRSISEPPYISTPGPSGGHAGGHGGYADSDFQTIKISQNAPKTLKLLPGKLQITNGLDKGKEFRMQAYPTPNGGILTIGRESKSGDAQFSHIQLLEKTVSRQQAEFIYKDGKLFLKNLSETNYTQYNGRELNPGEMTEIQPDSVIKTGEVEFRYIL